MRLTLLSIAVAMLVACQSMPSSPGREVPRLPSAAPATPAVVHGRASYLERIVLPQGAFLEVQLIDDGIADAQAPAGSASATVARMSYGELHGPPYAFALPYDPARVAPDGHYSLRATLREPGGRLAFATATRVPVKPGTATPVEFRLVRVAAPRGPRAR